MNLTPKQLKILTLIRDSRIVSGCSPTMQELADKLNISKVTVFEHVEALIKKGALARAFPVTCRGISTASGCTWSITSRCRCRPRRSRRFCRVIPATDGVLSYKRLCVGGHREERSDAAIQ